MAKAKQTDTAVDDSAQQEIASLKQQVRALKEQVCADELTRVLDRHKAKLQPLPDGTFQVVIEC